MKEVDWDIVPTGETMILLTAGGLEPNGLLFMADFKDTMALKFTPTGNYIGLTRNRGMRLGKGPKFMRNGVWFIYEDFEAQKRYTECELDMSLVTLENI